MANRYEYPARSALKPLRAELDGRSSAGGGAALLCQELPALRVDVRKPLGIVVASALALFRGADVRLQSLIDLLPAGSWIENLSGTVHRCRVEGEGEVLLGSSQVEYWFRERNPDVLYYPAIDDLEFGIHPLLWQQDLRISPGYVMINAGRGPSTVRERLLVREMMMAVSDFWPGDPDDTATLFLPGFCRGLSWLVRGNSGVAELEKWKPRRAVKPRVSLVEEVFGDGGRLASAAGLATLLAGDLSGGSNAVGKNPVFPTFCL